MTVFQAIVLGIVQGLAEFLPISSSAHLRLTPWLFGWQEPGLAFDVALHLGTLIALVWFFWQEWITLTKAFFSGMKNGCSLFSGKSHCHQESCCPTCAAS